MLESIGYHGSAYLEWPGSLVLLVFSAVCLVMAMGGILWHREVR